VGLGGRVEGADKITVGLTSLSPAAAPLYLTKDKGFFEAEGIEVTIPIFKSGTENAQAVLAGEVHIAKGSTELFNIRKAGQDARFFWGVANIMPFKLYAKPDIKTGQDLKGKKLAVSKFGAQSDTLTRMALKHFGVEPMREAAILQVGSTPARYAAMKSGSVDATLMWFPQTILADKEGYRRLLDLSVLISDWPYMAFYAKADYLRARRDLVVRFLRAYRKGLAYAMANPNEAVATVAKSLKYEIPVAEAGWKEFAATMPADGRLPMKGIEYLIQEEKETSKEPFSVTAPDLVDTSFVDQFKRTQ
jgi:NitT/TauT family transport system substrate-binding protein